MADRQVDRGLRERGMSTATDVAIIGGGIVGCAAAAFLAEAGAKVGLYERDEVGAAASGRNSGSIQHPFDSVLAELHLKTLEHYRGLDGLELADAPARVLMLAPERASVEPAVDEMPLWGVVADVEMEDPPRHVLEEAGVEEVAATVRPGRPRRSSASSRPTARSPWGRPSFRTRRSRRRGRAGCDGAASASCRGWRARSSWAHAPARARSRWTAGRWWASCRGSRASRRPPATGRGASRPVRRRRGSLRHALLGRAEVPRLYPWRASSSSPRAEDP